MKHYTVHKGTEKKCCKLWKSGFDEEYKKTEDEYLLSWGKDVVSYW
jgi:hypothetical protein